MTLCASASAAPQPAAPSPVLIELFTAEGCSSCPPADDFLAQLDAKQPVPGAHLIVLSEHVDYWDAQGWSDPYASKAFTERQVAYERRLRVSEPFTPQFIVDGSTDMRLSRRERISQQLRSAADAAKMQISIESLSVEGGVAPALHGVVRIERVTANRPCELLLAVALDHADTEVARGENRGRHLSHVAVLRHLERIGTVAPGTGGAENPFTIALAGRDARPLRVIAFIQEPGPGAVLAAAEKTLSE